VEDAQYTVPFRLDSVKNQVVAVTRNRPEAHADFLLLRGSFNAVPFFGVFSS